MNCAALLLAFSSTCRGLQHSTAMVGPFEPSKKLQKIVADGVPTVRFESFPFKTFFNFFLLLVKPKGYQKMQQKICKNKTCKKRENIYWFANKII